MLFNITSYKLFFIFIINIEIYIILYLFKSNIINLFFKLFKHPHPNIFHLIFLTLNFVIS